MYNLRGFRKDETLRKVVNGFVVDLGSPNKISYAWNFGSILGLNLLLQLVSGVFLSFFYTPSTAIAFRQVDRIEREVGGGWLIRLFHVTGSSCFFLFLYLHIGRGLYFFSFLKLKVWSSGVILLILSMLVGFLGYVLPWGQMSYWGATVISNFASVIPLVGRKLVSWIWGGFSVDFPTLSRFYRLHFLIPFIMCVIVGLHLVYLHEVTRKKPLGLKRGDYLHFFPYFVSKDFLGFFFLGGGIFFLMWNPRFCFESQNFIEANPLTTPPHIQPEWYFLRAYAVLRAIPKKLGGVIGLASFVLILLAFPLFTPSQECKKLSFNILGQIWFWVFRRNFFLLTAIGALPVENPFILVGQVSTLFYFSYFFFKNWALTFGSG